MAHDTPGPVGVHHTGARERPRVPRRLPVSPRLPRLGEPPLPSRRRHERDDRWRVARPARGALPAATAARACGARLREPMGRETQRTDRQRPPVVRTRCRTPLCRARRALGAMDLAIVPQGAPCRSRLHLTCPSASHHLGLSSISPYLTSPQGLLGLRAGARGQPAGGIRRLAADGPS